MNCIGNDGSAGLSITPNNGEDTEQSIILSSLNFINCGSGTAFIVNKIGITLYGCEFTINEETSKSSGILIQNPWGCYLYNCTFTKCEGNLGGALCSETDKEIHVIDTRFISNKASINGGSIHIVNQEAVVILEGSHFDSCFSTNIGAGSISLENCIKILSIENCKFSNQQSAYCIMLNADIINFMNNFFENCFCNDKKYGGAGIYLANGKDYKFNNITFSNCIPNSNENSKAYLVIPGDFKNTLELIGCHFRGKGVYDDNDKAIFISNQETKLVLQSCEFLNLKTQKGSGCAIGSHSNSFECENCQFTECSGWSVFHFWKLLDISFKNVIFKNCVAACKTGFIYHEVAESFELLNCSVIGCKSQFLGSNPKYDGGAIRIHDGVQSVKIELCEFKDCTGTVTFQIKPMGGCIRISDSVTSVSISSCSFSRSSAYSGNALYFGNNQEASYNIFNSSFSDNSNPGEVIFSHSSLDITNCTIEFTSNSQACTGIIGNKYLKLTNVIFINCKVNKPINSKIFSNKYTRHQKTLLENSKSMNEDSTYNKDDGGAVKCFEKVEIKMCRFEKCVAQTGYGGAIYCKLVEDSFIEDSIFCSNTANQAGAIFIQSSNFFSLKNNRFLYNDAQTSASSFIFNIDGDVNIELCNFTSILNENEIYQCAFINIGDILWIHVRPKITLDSCYFVCENPNGLEVDNVLHLFSSSESKVILQKDVCFDCPQERAIKLSNMELLENNIGEGAFNCLGGELLPTTIEDDDPNVKTKTENPTQKPEATVYPNNSDVPSIDIIPSSTLDSSCSNGGTVEDEDLLGITKTTSFIIVSVVVVVIIIIIIIIVLVRKKKSDKSDKKSKSKRHNKSDIESSKHKTRKEKKSKKKKETSDPPSEQHETLTSDSDEILDPITRAYESSSNYDDRFFDNDDIPQYNVDPLDRSSSSDENSEWINRYEL